MMVGFSRRQNVDVYFVRWFCQVPVPEIVFRAYEKISTFKSWPLKCIEKYSRATFLTYLFSFKSILGTLIFFWDFKKVSVGRVE